MAPTKEELLEQLSEAQKVIEDQKFRLSSLSDSASNEKIKRMEAFESRFGTFDELKLQEFYDFRKKQEEERAKADRAAELLAQLQELGFSSDGFNLTKNKDLARKFKTEDSDKSDHVVENRMTKVDYSWVVELKGPKNFKRWADSFLLKARSAFREYRDRDKAEEDFANALLIAAEKGGFVEGVDDITLRRKQGLTGNALLESLREKYQVVAARDLKQKEAALTDIKRLKGESLYDAVHRLKQCIAECEINGYQVPDRECRLRLQQVLYTFEQKEILQRARQDARHNHVQPLEGTGFDEYLFDHYFETAKYLALDNEIIYGGSRENKKRRESAHAVVDRSDRNPPRRPEPEKPEES